VRAARWFTILVALCGTGYALLSGATLAYFGAEQDGSISSETVGPFTRAAGVEYASRDDLLSSSVQGSKLPDSVAKAISDVLSIRPTSAGYWLSLARVEASAGSLSESARQALNMSVLTGRDEPYLVAARALFGLAIWEVAPASVREQVTEDLGSALPMLSSEELKRVKSLLDQEAADAKSGIKLRLLGQGVRQKRLAEIGL